MLSITATLGLGARSYVGEALLVQWFFANVFNSSRVLKRRWKLDDNVCPRDADARIEQAVTAGKITRSQVEKLRRVDAAQANSQEHYSLFASALILGTIAGLDVETLNLSALLYILTRIGYSIAYTSTTTRGQSFVRSGLWWVSNIICGTLLIKSGKALSSLKI